MEQITVASFMTEDILTVEPSDSADQVIHQMAACRVSCLVVCEEDKPVGIITERDMVQYWAKWSVGTEKLPMTAGEMMTSSLVTVRSCVSLDEAVSATQDGKIRHLPVVDDGDRLVGLLTQTDLLRAKYATAPSTETA